MNRPEILSGITSSGSGHSAHVEQDRSALVRIAVLCRLLAEALDELETDLPTAQLALELTALRERAEREISD